MPVPINDSRFTAAYKPISTSPSLIPRCTPEASRRTTRATIESPSQYKPSPSSDRFADKRRDKTCGTGRGLHSGIRERDVAGCKACAGDCMDRPPCCGQRGGDVQADVGEVVCGVFDREREVPDVCGSKRHHRVVAGGKRDVDVVGT